MSESHNRGGEPSYGQEQLHPDLRRYRRIGESRAMGWPTGWPRRRAGRQLDEVPDRVRWQTSLPRRSRRTTTERRAVATAQWIRGHVRPERRYRPSGGSGFRRRALRRIRKATAQRYYQLLSGHAAIGSFLHDRMTGPQRLESDECWWYNCGKWQPRHHLFVECRAWSPQIRELWQGVGKDCGWSTLGRQC